MGIHVDYSIDWSRLRQKILDAPIVAPVKHIKHPHRSAESLEKRRIRARERARERYAENPSAAMQRNRQWELDNPDKVKKKKKHFYDSHKNDPVFLAKKREQNHKYKEKKRLERLNNPG